MLGLTVLPHELFNSLNKTVADASRPKEYTPRELQALAKKHGYILVPESEGSPVETRAKSPGTVVPLMMPGSRRTSTSSISSPRSPSSSPPLGNLSMETIGNEASKRGLVLISQKEHSILKEAVPGDLSVDELRQRASSKNLHILTEDDFQNLKSTPSARVINERSLKSDAERLGFALIPTEEYKELKFSASGTNPKPAEGFITVPVDVYDELSTRRSPSEPFTREQVKDEADKLGLVTITAEEYNALRKQKGISSDLPVLREVNVGKVPGPDSNSDTTDHRWSASVHTSRLHETPSFISGGSSNLGPLSSTALDIKENQNNTHSPVGASRQLLGAPVFKTSGGHESESVVRNGQSPVAGSVLNMRTMSVGTHVSLADKHLVSVITQVVIGEYLFKYTRRLGLSGISENRHERYFWIHPYTLTLYWSVDNPSGHSRYGNKAKSVAIVNVRQEEDSNPLPPGLFHKSIIIQGADNRTLKITCPTRQRHNIWYSALLHLLKRSGDVPAVDDDGEDFIGDYNEDERLQQERVKAHTSPGRPMSRMSSLRQGIAPEMNRSRSARSSFVPPSRISSYINRRPSTIHSDSKSVSSRLSDASAFLDKISDNRSK